jgi:MFS family permease
VLSNLNKSTVQARNALWTRKFVVLNIVNTFSSFSFNMIYSIMFKYLVGLGASLTFSGIIFSVFAITALIIRPVSGIASDKFNKKNILMISSFLLGICVLGYSFSTNLTFILILRIFHGIAFGMSGTAAVALASDYIPKDRMGEGIGYLGLSQIISSAVAPGFGITLVNMFGSYNITFSIASLLAILGALLLIPFKATKILQTANKVKINFNSLIAKEAVFFGFIAFFISFANAIISIFILLIANQKHINNISLYFMVSAIFLFLARILFGRVVDSKGIAILFYPSIIIFIISMVLHGLATTLWMFLLGAALNGISTGCIAPALQTECIRKAGRDRSGVANSTYYLGMDIANGVAPLIGGVIASFFNYAATFYFAGFLLLVGGILFYLYSKRWVNK